MTKDQMLSHLRACNELAVKAVNEGHHPFGAILIAPDDVTILMEQGNISTVRHAETELARNAAEHYESDFLWKCSLVTTVEPCAMCTGTIYWANIGRIVYGVAESELLELTGSDERNPTLSLPCRNVIKAGQKEIAIHGPFAELHETLMQPHRAFWTE